MAGQRNSSRPTQKNVKFTKNASRAERRKQFEEDLQKLQEAVDNYDPVAASAKIFSDFPLSSATATGLVDSHFQVPTDIQERAIPLALKGRDVLGAAKTGSGKTLAFLIPILENLYRTRWTDLDGLGALVISPTRELAVQTFEVLRKIGRHHAFSAGLIIGGKSLKEEAERLSRMNILICTPGRMLQHLDQTAGLDVDNLQMLVLDEADRIMDMGFQTAVDALVDHLPRSRQTLMFSATQSKKVSDLARLSLKEPEYISVHSASASATPAELQQHYIVTPLPEKLDTLFGFVKANLRSKIIVFLSSGKQVRFVYESFRHLQPGIPLLHLHGRQRQLARLEITSRFAAAKYTCLFATDVVARGVDFPAVDWVIQADCPEDADTYIHRAGRTARYGSKGRAVLFLDPSEEEGMIRKLEHKKVPIQKVSVKESKKRSIRNQLQSMCFQNPDLKYLGQKAFISYTRSIHLQRDTEVFKFDQLDLDGFAASLGLPGTPQIRYQKGDDIKKIKNAPRALLSSGSESEDELGDQLKKRKKTDVRTKYDRMFERTNQDVLSAHYTRLIGQGGAADSRDADTDASVEGNDDDDNDNDDTDFLSVKRRLGGDNDDELDGTTDVYGQTRIVTINGQPLVIDSKRREKMLKSKKKMRKLLGKPDRIVFDDEGKPRPLYELRDEDDFRRAGPVDEQRQKYVQSETSRVREADVDDRVLAKQKRKEKREKRKAREAEARGDESRVKGSSRVAVIGNRVAEDGEEDPLTFLRSLPMTGQNASDSEEQVLEQDAGQVSEQEPEEIRSIKRLKREKGKDEGKQRERGKENTRKWFQTEPDSDDGRPPKRTKGFAKNRAAELDQDVDNLDDLEALATGLFDD